MIITPRPLRERLLDPSGRRFADPRSHFSRVHKQRGFLSVFQAGQLGRRVIGAGAVANNDLIRLLFNGSHGAQVFTDDGTAGTTWTPSNGTVTTSTTQFKEGTAALNISSSTQSLAGPYTSSNWISSLGFVGFWYRAAAINVNTPLVGVTSSGFAAASFGWLFYINSANTLQLYYSNGTTTSHITATATSANTWMYCSMYIQSSVVYLQVDGGSSATASLAAINTPSGRNLKFGADDDGDATSTNGYWDMFQLRRTIPAGIPGGGASFTPPTSPFA